MVLSSRRLRLILYGALQRPDKQIIDIIEYNLEQLDALSIEELDLLRETVDGLISHMEYLKERHPDNDI